MKTNIITLIMTGAFTLTSAYAQTDPTGETKAPIVVNVVNVDNVDNFNKAQTDFEFAGIIKLSGINQVHSNRTPTPIDKQNVIRMNRDTLYSLGVIDISQGATVTLPNSGKRYMSLMVINNEGYVNEVYYGAGAYELTMEKFETPYVGVVIRTLANPEDAADLAIAHKLQDQIQISAGSDQPFVVPNYDQASYQATLDAILELAKGLKRFTQTFGSKADVDPVHFLIGNASAWGGLPDTWHMCQARVAGNLHRFQLQMSVTGKLFVGCSMFTSSGSTWCRFHRDIPTKKTPKMSHISDLNMSANLIWERL